MSTILRNIAVIPPRKEIADLLEKQDAEIKRLNTDLTEMTDRCVSLLQCLHEERASRAAGSVK